MRICDFPLKLPAGEALKLGAPGGDRGTTITPCAGAGVGFGTRASGIEQQNQGLFRQHDFGARVHLWGQLPPSVRQKAAMARRPVWDPQGPRTMMGPSCGAHGAGAHFGHTVDAVSHEQLLRRPLRSSSRSAASRENHRRWHFCFLGATWLFFANLTNPGRITS